MPRRSSSQTHSGIAADPMSTIGRRQIVATKLYGYDWWPTQGSPHRRSYEAVADALAEAGTKLVLVQNQLDPMPASDVQQLPPEGEYDDLRFIRFPASGRSGRQAPNGPRIGSTASARGVASASPSRGVPGMRHRGRCFSRRRIMTYHWSDILAEDATAGGQYSAALHEFAGRP